MMVKRARDYLAMILVSILFYIPMFIRTPNFAFLGNDSYYFLNYIFYQTKLQVSTFIQESLFGLLPANILVLKLIMLLITILCLIIFYETVETIKKNRGLLASLFLLNTFWFSWIFMKLEDDLFGLPFVLISLYFLVRYLYKTDRTKLLDLNIILSLAFLFIGVLIWNYAIYFVIAFLFISQFHKLYIFASLTLIPFLPRLIIAIRPNLLISENQPLKAIIVLCLIGFLYFKKVRLKETWLAVLVFSCLSLINIKLIYILVPILLLSFVNVDLNESLKIRNTIIFVLVLLFSVAVYQNMITYPTNKEYELVSIAQEYSLMQNKEIYFNWSVGYFAIWHNFDAKDFGSVPAKETDYKNKIIVTTKLDKKIKSCEIIKKSKWLTLASC